MLRTDVLGQIKMIPGFKLILAGDMPVYTYNGYIFTIGYFGISVDYERDDISAWVPIKDIKSFHDFMKPYSK